MLFLHICDIQVLKHDRAEPIHHHPGGLVSKSCGVDWRSVHGCVQQPFRSSTLRFSKVSFAPSQALSRRCGRTADSRFFSPFEKVAEDSRPASTRPRYLSLVQEQVFSRAGAGSYSTEKQAYHFPVAVLRIVNVLIVPSMGRWRDDRDITNFRCRGACRHR